MTDQLPERIDQLYRAFAPACLGYARTLCWPDGVSDAEDIVHDVFVKLFHQANPPAGETARSYLLAAIRNAAGNRRRDAVRGRNHLRQLAEREPVFSPPTAWETGPDLGELLVGLPAEQREVVYLKIWCERTFAQIGELTGSPLQTVASRFRYGLAKIRELMESKRDV